MRRRGFIILFATVPAWITEIVLGYYFEKENAMWGYEAQPPDYLRGIGIAALLGTLVGMFVLLIDLNSWSKKRKINGGAD